MIEQLVWDRFRQDWKQFAWMAIWTFLAGGAVVLPILMFVVAWFTGSYVSSTLDGAAMGPSNALDTGGMMRTAIILMLMVVAASIAFIALIQAGLMAQVVAFRRGQPTGFGTFWTGVRRHWASLLLPALFWAGLGLVSGASFFEQPLRQAVVGLIVAFLGLHLGIYPAYLIVADDMGSMSAMGRGLRILVAQPREALSGILALWLMQMVVGVLGELVGLGSPFLLLPWAIVLMFYVPLVPYYFAECFEQKLRPVLN